MSIKHVLALTAVISILAVEPSAARDCDSMVGSLNWDLDVMIANMHRINSKPMVDRAADCAEVRRQLSLIEAAHSTIDACLVGGERDATLTELKIAIVANELYIAVQCAERNH